MGKLLVIYNFAQAYRKGIFLEIEKAWDCDWIFGDNSTDIKEMDTSLLKNVRRVRNKRYGPLKVQTEIAKICRSDEYDTILVLGELLNLSMWRIFIENALRKKKKKLFIWTHGWYGREGLAKRKLKRLFFSMADKVLLYGNFAKDVAISQGFNAAKLDVIHNSLDHKQQLKLRAGLTKTDVYTKHFGNDYPTIIFIGRLSSVKKLDQLVEAVALLSDSGEMYNLVFVGGGEMNDSLHALVAQKGLTDQVWFYGACYDDTQNASLIYNADMCVAPGNVGLTAMHTMVFGTPVLTHDNFPLQMPEFEAVIPGKTGDFFHYDDVVSIADCISNWNANYGTRREEIRQNCYKEIDENWTPQFQMAVLRKYIDE